MKLNLKEDLHIHCNYNDHSDQNLTIPNVIKRAEELKLGRIAITEHVRKSSDWTCMYMKELEKYSKNSSVDILKGFEAKILSNGDIDCPDEYLSQDFFIIASFHTKYDKNQWSSSLVEAIKNPYVRVIGHLAPETTFGVEDDEVRRIGNLVYDHNKVIEINAKYVRPPTRFIEIFKEIGVNFHVGSDAHSLKEIGDFNRIKHLINLIEK